MYKYFFAFLMIATVFIANSAFAQNVCSKKKPQIIVSKVSKATEYIRGQSVQSMTSLHTGSARKGGPAVYGLGGGTFGINVETSFATEELPNGMVCSYLTRVKGQVVTYPAIMIADTFRKGSCEYNAVMQHEHKHVKALKDFQNAYAYKYKKFLKSFLKNIGGPVVTTIYQQRSLEQGIADRIANATKGYVEQITPIIQKKQIDIDTAEEYARVFSLCDDWASATAPKYQRRYR